MGWVEIMPRYESLFRRLRWATAAPFLAWTGILVNRHRDRRVEQVCLPSPLRGRGEEAKRPLSPKGRGEECVSF